MSRSIRVIIPSQTVQGRPQLGSVSSPLHRRGCCYCLWQHTLNRPHLIAASPTCKPSSPERLQKAGEPHRNRDRRLRLRSWRTGSQEGHSRGVAAGTGIAVMAANVLSWLWGA